MGNPVANEIDVFGELYFDNIATPLEAVLTDANTYYSLGGLTKKCDFNITIDGTTASMTAKVDGLYDFDGVASIFPSAGTVITFALFVNDVEQAHIKTVLEFQNNQDTNTFSGSGFVRLVAGDVVTVRAKSTTAVLTLKVSNINLSLMRMGL